MVVVDLDIPGFVIELCKTDAPLVVDPKATFSVAELGQPKRLWWPSGPLLVLACPRTLFRQSSLAQSIQEVLQ